MKLISAFVTVTFVISSLTGERTQGSWKGNYGDENYFHQLEVKLMPNNLASVSLIEPAGITYGSGRFKTFGDSTIIIACTLGGGDMILQGRLNRTLTFIDGDWTAGQYKGCFYLQKHE